MKKTKNYLHRNFGRKRDEDLLSKERRSLLMSKIRSEGTKFENNFIKALTKATRKKFQTNVTAVKGKPDVVFPKDGLCVFLDSDFWHGWYYPKWKHLLKNKFWRTKIEKNRKRDRKITLYLRRNGWTVLRFWEHSIIKKSDKAIREIENNLRKQRS